MPPSQSLPEMEQILAMLGELSGRLNQLTSGQQEQLAAVLDRLRAAAPASGRREESSTPTTGQFFYHLDGAAVVFRAVRDPSGQVVDWLLININHIALQLLAAPPGDDPTGKTVRAVLGEAHHQNIDPVNRQVLESGKPSTRQGQLGGEFFNISTFKVDDDHCGSIAVNVTAQKRSEEALQQINLALALREARYRDLAESIDDGFFELDPDWRFIFLNRRAAATIRQDQDSLIGKTIWTMIPDLVGTPNEQIYRQVMQTRQPADLEIPGLLSDRWYSVRVYPTTNGIAVLWIDITEQKQTEQALIQAHQRAEWMARFPEEDPNPVARVSMDGIVLYKNRGTGDPNCWGFELGQPVPDMFKPLLETAIQTGEKISQDIAIGQAFFSVTLMPFLEDQYVNIYGLDITERKMTEAALHESEARAREHSSEMEALMDAAPAIIWITRDPETHQLIGNRYSYDFLNIAQGENVSKTAPPDDLAVQHYHMEKDGVVLQPENLPIQIAARTGAPVRDFTADIVLDDGTRFSLLGNVNPLFDSDGQPYGAIGVFVDLTALRRLEAEQAQSKTALELQRRLMNQREQDRLAIARDLHDGPIQTLSSIAIQLHIIKNHAADPELQKELDKVGEDVRGTIQELREIMNELRPALLMHFGFARAIQAYINDLSPRFPQIEIDLDIRGDDRRLSDLTRLTLFRIFQSAIANIIRHSDASNATLHIFIDEDSYLLELSDNGKGFQVPSSFTRLAREGHFGLVGMRERAEAIRATFSITSEPGRGTTIIIKGPILPEEG